MAIFSSGGDSAHDPRERGPVRDNNLSIIAPGMRIAGDLTTDGVVKIEGTVKGSIRARQQILVAKGGTVEGDLYSREAIIGGKVLGGIYADERVEVQPGSTVNGDITAQRIVVQEGGEVNGHVRVGRPADSAPPRQEQRSTGAPIPPRQPVAPIGSSR